MRASDVTQRAALSLDRPTFVAMSTVVFVAIAVIGFGPENVTVGLFAVAALVIVSRRPEWGVAAILTMLMVQYGQRRFERTEAGVISTLLPAGEGLLTPNNVLGLYLALLLVYQVYRDNDWSFLRNRQIQLVLLITVFLIGSAYLNGVDYAEQAELGLRVTGQSPIRAIVSRGLFLVLLISFVRAPHAFRLLIAVFVGLALVTAFSGSTAALTTGTDVPIAAAYRAGGLGVLIETAGNPNRLAMIATLALIIVWEFSQSELRASLRWLAGAAVLLLVLTVFLSASRGGVIGLAATTLFLFVARRNLTRRVLYGGVMVLLGALVVNEVLPEQTRARLSTVPVIGEESGEGGRSIGRREYTYGIAYDIWSTAPVTGVGLGNWEFMRFTTDPMRSAAVPHNSYLLALSEGGIITLGLYLALFVITLRQLNDLLRRPDVLEQLRRDRVEWAVRAARVCLLSLLVFSVFADLWELIFFYFVIGLAGALVRTYQPVDPYGAPA